MKKLAAMVYLILAIGCQSETEKKVKEQEKAGTKDTIDKIDEYSAAHDSTKLLLQNKYKEIKKIKADSTTLGLRTRIEKILIMQNPSELDLDEARILIGRLQVREDAK